MEDRLWNEYRLTVLYIHFIPLYIEKKETFNKWFEFTLQVLSFLSTIGLFKYIEHYIVFGTILGAVSAVRFFKSYLITPEKDITTYKKVLMDYINNNIFLENLWYKHRAKQIDGDEVQRTLDQYLIDELKTIALHDALKDKKLLAQAEEKTVTYINTKFNYGKEKQTTTT